MQNTYQIKNSNCSSSAIALTVKDKSVTVSFVNRRRNGILLYDTENADIQVAIEASPRFKSGEITRTVGEKPVISSVVGSKKLVVGSKKPVVDEEIVDEEIVDEEKLPVDELPVITPVGPTVFAEIASWQAAKELLRSEPYNVTFQALNTPANILKKAAELGVSFPNLAE